jgi:hypothetical protein
VNRVPHLWRNTHRVMSWQFGIGPNGLLEMYFPDKEHHVDPTESDILCAHCTLCADHSGRAV